MADEDTRRLIPMSVKKLDDNLYSIEIEGGESYKVECNYDSIKKVFRRIKAKDGCEHGKCRSSKIGTYASMLGDENNTDLHKINVWKSKVPHNSNEFIKLMTEDDNMKKITLSKNYIIEGNIFKKGTSVEFKEAETENGKIAFLPTNIWEKAKEIADENERFEFVKKELGDEFTDEEIKNFLNKHEDDLMESKKEKVVILNESDDDLVEFIKDTLEDDDNIKDNEIKDVAVKASKDKKIINAWEDVLDEDADTMKNLKIFEKLLKDFVKNNI